MTSATNAIGSQKMNNALMPSPILINTTCAITHTETLVSCSARTVHFTFVPQFRERNARVPPVIAPDSHPDVFQLARKIVFIRIALGVGDAHGDARASRDWL